MAYIGMTLTDPVSGLSVPIQPVDGVSVQTLDVQPVVRAVTEDRVAALGAYDTTTLLSAAAVTATIRLYPTAGGAGPEVFLDQVGPLLSPAVRPYLIVTNDQWAQQRQLQVRYDSRVAPVSDPTFTDVVISWVAPNGVWEAATPVSLVVGASMPTTTGLAFKAADGVHFKAADGLHFVFASNTGEFTTTNPGTAPSQWTAFLYGPCQGPKLANDTTGLTLEFTDDITLGAGQFLALDSGARTVWLNNDPASDELEDLNFPTSDWWQLQPGVNQIRYYPSSAQGGAEAFITYRPAWMT